MKAMVCGVLLLGGVHGVMAQDVRAGLQVSHDSDSFNERKQTLGYTSSSGFGIRAGALQYSAPGWSATGSTLAATYRKVDRAQSTDASLGMARVAGHDYLTGMLDYMRVLTPSTSLGVSLEREAVNSIRGLDGGVAYTSAVLVADHAFSQRFNVGVSAGSTVFSNDNQRPIVRSRWNYSLDEHYGLNAFVKTRNYWNRNPYRPEYFSPDRLSEVSVGLSTRFVVADSAVFSASLGTGRQRIDGGSEPIWSVQLGLASPRKSTYEWAVGLEATNAASLFTTQAVSYRYVSAFARLRVPF